MTEWCECNGATTFMALTPTGLDGNEAWVHSECGKPTFEYWQKHEKYCDECGRSFSSPYSDTCVYCTPHEFLVTWVHSLQLTAAMRPFGPAADAVKKTAA